ncbi:IclR family transcriptional regulator [Psychromarinibacter sp. C21-152]|uniref:IclR family transcriptional regulator n=1 Tax=Psychromarinibacter sediminicola TaxID=3033385 RepID=A0AAE3NSL0_9RHOB|nr:IclR family transcriptional regulator [Psychromarinibacter sediminicola]MDF0601699.1 IclR family transcriptional regulator [Psychromarinibacter sediminicola]
MAEISSTGDQMLQLLELVAFEGPRTTAELAAVAGINRTVAHRLLNTLHERGYVSRDGKAFNLGPILSQMAGSEKTNYVPRLARPVLDELANDIGECVVMHHMDGEEAVVIEQATSDAEIVRVQHRVGARHSLWVGASGLAILAWQDDQTLKRLLAKQKNPGEMRSRLSSIVEKGYAITKNELQLGVAGAAVPIIEPGKSVRYSLAILVPEQRWERLPDNINRLIAAKKTIEKLITEDCVPAK